MSSGFDDVSDDSVHAAMINCLAYYGITKGKTTDTFDPSGNVTRSQMALFLARAADAAGIDLGDDMGSGFTDLNPDDTERVSAINRLVAKGIMFGDTATSFDPPSTTLFAPGEPVTRWEMAMFLFAFVDHALDSVLVDNDPFDDNDPVGQIEIGDDDGDGNGDPVDDWFGDARRETPAHVDARIGAIFELGITTGVNHEVGARGEFDPNGLVTRAQMASFIMRTLNHTDLRPAGVTAQYVDNSDGTRTTQVAVRDANFDPVPDKRVEVFYTSFEQVAFDSDGECVERYVGAYEQTPREACEIDRADQLTDDDGYVEYDEKVSAVNSLTIHCTGAPSGTHVLAIDKPSSAAVFKAWAWQGDLYDTIDSDTERFEVVAGNANPGVAAAPTHAVVTGGKPITKGTQLATDANDIYPNVATGAESYHVKMGEMLEYTIQLSSVNTDPVTKTAKPYVTALPVSGTQYGFTVTELRITQDLVTGQSTASVQDFPFDINAGLNPDVLAVRLPRVYRPDENGQIKIQIRQPDPLRSGAKRDNADVQVQIQVTPVQGNTLTVVNSTSGYAIDASGVTAGQGWLTTTDTITRAATATTPVHSNSRAVRFSDNDPWAATVSVEPERALRVLAESKRGYVSVEVKDQYGNPFKPLKNTVYKTSLDSYTVSVDPGSARKSDGTSEDATDVAVRSRGKATHAYRYGGPHDDSDAPRTATDSSDHSVETVKITAHLLDLREDSTVPLAGTSVPFTANTTLTATTTETAISSMVYWASNGEEDRETTGEEVLVADVAQRLIAVDERDQNIDYIQPTVYEYGSEDRFTAEGEVVSFKQFEDILDSTLINPAGDDSNDYAMLEWDDYYRHGLSRRPTTDATWRLSDLNNCEASS